MTGVPYTFSAATAPVPLSQLDANFNTTLTIGSTSVGLGNTVTTVSGLTLSSPTISGTVGGALTFSGALTLSSALTYGGVTLSNSVTGTGSMVLSASPTHTGTLTAAIINASGLITGTAGFSNGTAAFGTPNTTSPTRTGTIANNATQTINTQTYGLLYITEDLQTGDSALIGASQNTAVIWQKSSSFSSTQGTSGKYNVYITGGVLTIENKSGSNARFAIVNLMGPS